MKPNKPGIWEWFEEDGTKRLVCVCCLGKDWLRVYWWGGYYSVNPEPETPGLEWPDRWGSFIGENESVPDEQLYLGPTPEQAEKIRKRYSDDSGKVHP
jgi:hypothetical protein